MKIPQTVWVVYHTSWNKLMSVCNTREQARNYIRECKRLQFAYADGLDIFQYHTLSYVKKSRSKLNKLCECGRCCYCGGMYTCTNGCVTNGR
jgi:hypothetical protein